METLLYFVLWGALIFFMMRVGCGAHVTGKRTGRRGADEPEGPAPSPDTLRWVPPPEDTDPVCGKRVCTERAKPSVHDGHVFYFCSRECREAFEAAPDLYLGDTRSDPRRLEHSHV